MQGAGEVGDKDIAVIKIRSSGVSLWVWMGARFLSVGKGVQDQPLAQDVLLKA